MACEIDFRCGGFEYEYAVSGAVVKQDKDMDGR